MPGRELNVELDRALLISTVHEAGKVAMRYWKKNPQVWEKADGAGPVSEADLAINSLLKQQLETARPSYGWLSEETPDDPHRLGKSLVFIVDPLDGTRAFLAGEDTFAISLAVALRGEVVAGVVYLPARDVTYSATLGHAAYRDDVVITASTRTELDGADVLATRTSLQPEFWPGGLPELKRSYRASLAFRFCRVAEGRHDAMVTLRDTWEWDSAAGSLIAQSAGCLVSDRWGEPLQFNRAVPKSAGVLAAPADLYEGFIHAAPPKKTMLDDDPLAV